MSILCSDDAEYNFGGSRTRILISGTQTSDAYCVLEMRSPAGRATPTHHHDREDETLIMLEGQLDVIVEGARQTLQVGASVTLMRGIRHQLVNTSSEAARYLVVCAPAGFDRFVEACANPQPAPVDMVELNPADKARMREAASRFGITLYPPVAASA
jgi:quercetin dioxygenase-like cupin family protein